MPPVPSDARTASGESAVTMPPNAPPEVVSYETSNVSTAGPPDGARNAGWDTRPLG